MKDILDVIVKWLGWGQSEGKGAKAPAKTDTGSERPVVLTDDYVAGRDKIRDAVIRNMARLVKSRRVAEGKALVIYMDDTYNYQMAVSGGLDEYIGTYIEANTDYGFRQYCIRLGKPEVHDVAVLICPGISMALRMPTASPDAQGPQPVQQQRVFSPAVVDVLEGRGSLKGGKPVELMPEDGRIYNIGIGSVQVIKNRSVRYNDIVIDDDESSPMFSFNKYVSRAHAHIVFRAGFGYYLYAEERGTPTYDKRTEISRNQSKTIPLDSVRTGQLLQDGDSIILNGNVILTFKVRKFESIH